jgi:hypothetical protein
VQGRQTERQSTCKRESTELWKQNESVLSAWKAEHGGKNGLLHPRLGDKLRKKTFAELVDMDIAQLWLESLPSMLSHPRKALLRAMLIPHRSSPKSWALAAGKKTNQKKPKLIIIIIIIKLQEPQARISARMRRHHRWWRWGRSSGNGWERDGEFRMMWIAVRKKSRLHTWFQAGSLRLFLHPTENF